MSFPLTHECDGRPDDTYAYLERVTRRNGEAAVWTLVFDGNGSAGWYEVTFCPWCGVRLEEPKP